MHGSDGTETPDSALRTLEEGIGRAEALLRAFRGVVPDGADPAGPVTSVAPVDAPVDASVEGLTRSAVAAPAEGLVTLVARASLRVQERVEARLAQRDDRPPQPDLPEWWPGDEWRRARTELERAAERSATMLRSAPGPEHRSVGAAVMSRVAPVLARRDVRLVARGLVVVAVLLTVVVQVLGVGRAPSAVGPPPSEAGAVGAEPAPVAPAPATSPPVAPAPATSPPVAPAPATPAPAPAPASPAEDATSGGSAPPEEVPTSVRRAPPVSLRAPAIEVEAQVVVVGLEPDGAMEIPSDVRTVGWYDPFEGAGVAPGEPGTAVIAGHVDSRTQGRGAFWSLRELEPGDVIDVEHADGTATRWEVESVVRYPKTDIPIEEIFTFGGAERLALITCGGEFDRSTRSYLDNYVVTAVPARTALAPAPALPATP